MQNLIHKNRAFDQKKNRLSQVTKKDDYSKKCINEILNNIPAPIYLKDIHGAYIFINKKYEELAHVRLVDIVGKSDFEVFPEPVATLFKSQDEEVIRKNKPCEFEETITLPNGLHTFITSKFPLYGEGGEIYAIAGFCTDITLRKHADEELKNYRDHLEQMVEERTQKIKQKTILVEEFNVALNILLQKRDEDKEKLEEKIMEKIEKLIFPYLHILKTKMLNSEGLTYLELIKSNLNEITSSFNKNISWQLSQLTSAEIQTIDLIKMGKTTKEIASLLKLSPTTISTHRQNIRSKLNLINKKVSLKTALLSNQK
jgi:PAS domain S-box-containing protein